MIRIQNILCPVDFFPASLKAFDYALRLASIYGARVHTIHVVSPIAPAVQEFPVDTSGYLAALQRQSMGELLKLKKKADKLEVSFTAEVPTGSVDAEIRNSLTRVRADLLVIGTHGSRGPERWIMGSEADRLIRSCPVPLVTIASVTTAHRPASGIRRILVTTDFSAGTSDALKYAFSIAQHCKARVTLLHVINDVAVEAVPALQPSLVSVVQRQLEKFAPAAAGGQNDFRTRVETGVPYSTILKLLETEKIDLLVMNVHGKSMLDRALLGSTAERVVRGALCPVLLIPPSAHLKKSGKA
jgi:nucleotide-binding universal stress UspA family protein